MNSPYFDVPEEKWSDITTRLIEDHPLSPKEIADIVLTAWDSVLSSTFGAHQFRIGTDIFPKPQIIGFLLHELITLELQTRYSGQWRGDTCAADKDCVYLLDDMYSFEIKTSSHKNRIFGNRSYAQGSTKGKKAKSGYYLAINFEDCNKIKSPSILMVRFGWLDSGDWVGQASATGQQSSLPLNLERSKLLQMYP